MAMLESCPNPAFVLRYRPSPSESIKFQNNQIILNIKFHTHFYKVPTFSDGILSPYHSCPPPTFQEINMQIYSSAIINGEFADRFGKRGSQFSPNGMPTYSIPFDISDAPAGTQSFAVVLEDKDAITASGFVWTHWLIADLQRTSVAENESLRATDYVQGANSWASVLGKLDIEEASCYGGMAPPNCRHRYELIVYALDTKLNLPRGFRFNDLHFAMQGHILASACVMGTYDV